MKWKSFAAGLAAAALVCAAPGCGRVPTSGTKTTSESASAQSESVKPADVSAKATAESVTRSLEKPVDSSAAAAADSVIAQAGLAASGGSSVLEELKRKEAEGTVERGSIQHYPEAGVYTFVADGVPCVVPDGLEKDAAVESSMLSSEPKAQSQALGAAESGGTRSIKTPPQEG